MEGWHLLPDLSQSVAREPASVSVTFATVKDAQAAYLALERMRLRGEYPKGWLHALQEAEYTVYYALKEIDAHDF